MFLRLRIANLSARNTVVVGVRMHKIMIVFFSSSDNIVAGAEKGYRINTATGTQCQETDSMEHLSHRHLVGGRPVELDEYL